MLTVTRPTEQPPPRTLEDAYKRYVGDEYISDWDAYEAAVDKILRGTVPIFGHLPTCRNAFFPADLNDIMSTMYEGEAVAQCIHCKGIVGHPFINTKTDHPIQPEKTEVVAR